MYAMFDLTTVFVRVRVRKCWIHFQSEHLPFAFLTLGALHSIMFANINKVRAMRRDFSLLILYIYLINLRDSKAKYTSKRWVSTAYTQTKYTNEMCTILSGTLARTNIYPFETHVLLFIKQE